MTGSSEPAADGSAAAAEGLRPRSERLRLYLFSDTTRSAQTILGLIWLLDGGLQFQSFMYSRGFIAMVRALAPGQPHWLASSIDWGARIAANDLSVYNTLSALIQIAIGLGLLHRRTVRPALLISFGWSLLVWWFGEAFGMLFANTAQPLTGAPGGVILYLLVGLVVWPNGRPGGLLGIRGARIMWAGLWLLCAYLWLLQASAAAGAVHDMIAAAPSGMGWLSSVQRAVADLARGDGLVLALILAALSAAIALGVGLNRYARPLLLASIVLQLLFWVVGQGFGGIFAGGATDPNAAPLFILLACTLAPLTRYRLVTAARADPAP